MKKKTSGHEMSLRNMPDDIWQFLHQEKDRRNSLRDGHTWSQTEIVYEALRYYQRSTSKTPVAQRIVRARTA